MVDRRAGAVLLFFACLYALSIGRGFYGSDGEVMFQTTTALALRGSVVLEPDPGLPQIVRGRDGHWVSKYDPGLPLLAVPFYALGDALAQVNAAHRAQVAAICVLLLPVLAAAATLVALWDIAARMGGAGRAAGVVFAAGLASPLWVYARTLFPEALLACALTWTVALLLRSGAGGRALAAGLIAGAGIAVRASFAVYLLPLIGLAAATTPGGGPQARLRRAARFAAGLLPGIALVLGHNALRFGAVLHTGYAGERFSTPVLKGALGLLISPGRGALLYAPPLLLSLALSRRVWRRMPPLAAFLALAWGSALIVFGAWWAWDGGWCWGPRLIVPLLPLSLLPLALLPPGHSWRWALGGLLLAGAAINAAGVLVDVAPHFSALAQGAPADVDRINWHLRESPVLWAAGQVVRGRSEPLGLLHLAASGLPPTWSLGVPFALGLGALVGARGLLQTLRRNGQPAAA